MYYPLFLDLSQINCLVVGAGKVGLRKVKGLIEAQAKHVLVLDINKFNDEWYALEQAGNIKLCTDDFLPSHLDGCGLVFACTANKELNLSIAKHCAEQGILCNCVDAPKSGSFIVPAIAKARIDEQHYIMAALSTEGASPAWSRVLRKELEMWLQPHAPMTLLLRRLRPLVLALGEDSEHNKQIFRSIVHSRLRECILNKDNLCCEELLHQILPMPLHNIIPELLHDII